MPKPGDLILVTTKKGTEQGILIPSPEKNFTLIKLSNGYNVGFKNQEVRELTVIKESQEKSLTKIKIEKDPNLPTISILHTGGTIASKVDYKTGGVTAQYSTQDLLKMVPELNTIANFNTELVANMMSEDMFFTDYQKIANSVKKHAKDADGMKDAIEEFGGQAYGRVWLASTQQTRVGGDFRGPARRAGRVHERAPAFPVVAQAVVGSGCAGVGSERDAGGRGTDESWAGVQSAVRAGARATAQYLA